MTGSLRVKNAKWQMIFSYKDTNGHWKKKSESTGLAERGNKRKAEVALQKRLAELNSMSKTQLTAENLLFVDGMKQWLDDTMVHEVRQNTLTTYLSVWRTHIATYPPFDGVRLSALTPALLQQYFTDKLKQGLAPETVKKHYANIHKYLSYTVRLDMLPYNPSDRVQLPKRNRSQRGSVYTAEQVQALIDAFRDDALHTLVLLTATYGLRRSEICALKWDSVTFTPDGSGHLQIVRTAVLDSGKILYADTTKTKTSRRQLPLTQQVTEHLKALKAEQEQTQAAIGAAYRNDGFVCCWPDGSPIRPDYATKHFAKVLKKNNLPPLQFRNLRDTAATLLHRQGFDVRSIQGWLGHADPSTTASIYVHFGNEDMTDMATAMNNIFSSK